MLSRDSTQKKYGKVEDRIGDVAQISSLFIYFAQVGAKAGNSSQVVVSSIYFTQIGVRNRT